jgi:hypothetical protein
MHPPFGRSLLGAFWTVVFAGLRGEERARRFLDMAIQGGIEGQWLSLTAIPLGYSLNSLDDYGAEENIPVCSPLVASGNI